MDKIGVGARVRRLRHFPRATCVTAASLEVPGLTSQKNSWPFSRQNHSTQDWPSESSSVPEDMVCRMKDLPTRCCPHSALRFNAHRYIQRSSKLDLHRVRGKKKGGGLFRWWIGQSKERAAFSNLYLKRVPARSDPRAAARSREGGGEPGGGQALMGLLSYFF